MQTLQCRVQPWQALQAAQHAPAWCPEGKLPSLPEGEAHQYDCQLTLASTRPFWLPIAVRVAVHTILPAVVSKLLGSLSS